MAGRIRVTRGSPISGAFGKILVATALSAALAACATETPPPTTARRTLPQGHGVYKIGDPYEVAGVWYYPHEQPNYDKTGIASWYGKEFHGHVTANGEVFDRNKLTAAHPTLPLPSNVRVTDLENGRSIVVRVNDRGPYVNGRIIDLSERAAELLGYHDKGTARVRVKYLGRAKLNGGGYVPPSEETPTSVATAVSAAPTANVATTALPAVPGTAVAPARALQPLPKPEPQETYVAARPEPDGKVTTVPVPAATAIYVQAGAYSTFDNAARVMSRLASLGARISRIMRDGKPLYRVRIGPFQQVNDADAMMAHVIARGHNDVAIVVD